jgi:hypothetical protein
MVTLLRVAVSGHAETLRTTAEEGAQTLSISNAPPLSSATDFICDLPAGTD